MSRSHSSNRQPGDELLTVDDLCAELSLPKSTFYKWRGKRLGPEALRLPSGQLRFRRSEVDRWAESLREGL